MEFLHKCLVDIFIKPRLVPNNFLKQAVSSERPEALANTHADCNTFTSSSNPKNKTCVAVAASSYGRGCHSELVLL